MRSAHQVFDEMLILYAVAGNRDAFDRLARKWRPKHYAHARRLLNRSDLASDAVQDAWISIVRGLWRLQEPARFPAWSYAIVTRRCQDLLRTAYREQASMVEGATVVSEPPDLTLVDDLQRGLRVLPNEQRAAIALFYTDDLSISDIAEALGIPEGTVKTRLFHARRTLRQFFKGEINE